MKELRRIKQMVAYLLSICLFVSGLCITDYSVVDAAEGTGENTTVYFLNGSDWETVGAYVYGDQGELLGGWGTTNAVSAEELGDKWMKVELSTNDPNFSIIFYNTAKDSERSEVWVGDGKLYIYNKVTYATQADAEAQYEQDVLNPETKVYFYNTQDWETVSAYSWGEQGEKLGVWPGVSANNVGDSWYEVTVPANPSFHLIFNDGVGGDGRQFDFYIENQKNVYASVSENGTPVLNETKRQAEEAAGVFNNTTMYFIDNKGWGEGNIGAYIWGDCGQILGTWDDSRVNDIVKPAPEVGDDWYKVEVPGVPPYNFIVYNRTTQETESQRAELYVADSSMIYVTGSNEVYASKLEAEASVGLADESEMTVAYFLNEREWEFVSAYTFTKPAGMEDDDDAPGTTLGKGWPGKDAEPDATMGDNWYKIVIPRVATESAPLFATINDGANRTEDVKITSISENYIIPTGEIFTTKEAAQEAAAQRAEDGTYDNGCEDGENADLVEVVYEKEAGANLPYVTYEAEAADTNAEVLEYDTTYRDAIQSEASGRQAVKLDETDDYVEFTLTESSNTMVLRYALPDSEDGAGIDATLSMSIDGEAYKDLEVTSKYAWLYGSYPFDNTTSKGNAHRFYDEIRLMLNKEYPAGTKIRLTKEAGDTAEYYVVDFIEGELVGEALTQPEGSLSVTEFGAIADDGQDDYAAFMACIKAAKEQGKEVWIPAGTFNLEKEKALETEHVNVRGAGMWYTNLEGAGVSFAFGGTCKFSDFAMTGVSTVRDDKGDLGGFEPKTRSTNATIENIWMEHIKVGVWSANTENLLIQGCRIRNTWADGINLCTLTKNATVRNNNLRNTGDDCIAIWPWLNDCTGNTIEHNTVQIPSLANGIAVYGGGENKVLNNYVADIIANGGGICIGSEFDIRKPFHDTTLVDGNVTERCGSMQFDENYPIGGIWIWTSYKNPMEATFKVQNNAIINSAHNGICVEIGNKLSGVILENNTITGGTDGIYIWGTSEGSAVFKDIDVTGYSGEIVKNEAANFTLTEEGKGVYDSSKADEDGKDDEEPSVSENTPGSEDGKDDEEPSVSENTPGSEDGKDDEEPSVSENTPGSEDGKDDEKPSVSDNTPGSGNEEGKDDETPSVSDNTPGIGDNGKEESGSGDDKNPTGNEGTPTPGQGNATQSGNENKQPNQEVKVTKIKITGASTKIAYNKSIKLTVNVTPAEASNKTVTWTVDNEKYASVTKNGVVKFKKAAIGKKVKVTATAIDGSGVKDTYKITVMKQAVSKIKLKAASSVKAGKSLKVNATVTPAKNVNKELNWTSSNTKYATVNQNGVVKAKKAGKGKTVKITAKATDGSGKKATIKIRIK